MTVALIVAAGLGERLGADRPKALVELAGRPLVQWSIDVLAGIEQIESLVLALPAGVPPPARTRWAGRSRRHRTATRCWSTTPPVRS